MNFPTIGDVKHIRSDLTDFERHLLINESRKMQEAQIIEAQIAYLGPRYLCSKQNAPAKGVYNHVGHRLA